MKTKRMMAALVVALLSVTAVMAKDIRTAVILKFHRCIAKIVNEK